MFFNCDHKAGGEYGERKILIPAISLIETGKDSDGFYIKINMNDGTFIQVRYASEKELKTELAVMERTIIDFYKWWQRG